MLKISEKRDHAQSRDAWLGVKLMMALNSNWNKRNTMQCIIFEQPIVLIKHEHGQEYRNNVSGS